MGLGRQKRTKQAFRGACHRASEWQDVAHGGRRQASRYIKAAKHAQTKRDRRDTKTIIRTALLECDF
jgi:hypothetical protein